MVPVTRRPIHRLGVAEHPWNDWTPAQRRYAVLMVLGRYNRNAMKPYVDGTPGGFPDRRMGGMSVQEVAWAIGVPPARRAGNGAVGGSWSGYMAPGLRVVGTLRSAEKAGLVEIMDDWTRERRADMYFLSAQGEDERRHLTPATHPELFAAIRAMQVHTEPFALPDHTAR